MRTPDKVLVVGAHPDDEAYGPGATIASMIYLKLWEVHLLTFTDGCNSEEDDTISITKQWKESCKVLGIENRVCLFLKDQQLDSYSIQKLSAYIQTSINNIKPKIVITHNITDLNRDHRLVSEATMVACRPKPNLSVNQVWMYEIPSSTDWAFGQYGSFEPNIFFELDSDLYYKTLDAIREYKNELEKYPHARSLTAISTLAQKRGNTVGVRFAEAFKLVWKRNVITKKLKNKL